MPYGDIHPKLKAKTKFLENLLMATGRKIDWSSIFFTNTTVVWRLDDRQAGVQTRSRNHEYDYAQS